jgi:hypothetical protein
MDSLVRGGYKRFDLKILTKNRPVHGDLDKGRDPGASAQIERHNDSAKDGVYAFPHLDLLF